MKDVYSVSIDRAGLADLPELVRCESPETAAEVVRCLLAAHDTSIMRVVVTVQRIQQV